MTAPVPQEASFFDAVGGEPTFRRLVDRFYEGVADDPLLRPMYPEEDLGPAADRLTLFLMQYWGGPNTYSSTRGHPRLRMRHAPFVVDAGRARRLADAHARRGRLAGPARAAPHRALGLPGARRLLHGQQHGVAALPDRDRWRQASLAEPPARLVPHGASVVDPADNRSPDISGYCARSRPHASPPARRRHTRQPSPCAVAAHSGRGRLAQPTVVSANPVDFTPHVLDGTVWTWRSSATRWWSAAPSPRSPTAPAGTTYARQEHLRVRPRTTARSSPFAPDVDGAVYAAGRRRRRHGLPGRRLQDGERRRATRPRPGRASTANRVSSFSAKINWGDVRALAARGNQLYAGGTFSAINGVNRDGAGPAQRVHRRGRHRLRRQAVRARPEPDPGRALRHLPGRAQAGRDRRAAASPAATTVRRSRCSTSPGRPRR